MNFEKRYFNIIEKLKAGHRYLEPISTAELILIKQRIRESLQFNDLDELKKMLCILDNTSSTYPELEEILLSTLENKKSDITIFLLNTIRKHVISGNQKLGNRLSLNLLNSLKLLLGHNDPEVVEWTLRTIEECGGQAIFLRKDIKNNRPKGIIINKHKLASRQIIDMLESKWSRFENR